MTYLSSLRIPSITIALLAAGMVFTSSALASDFDTSKTAKSLTAGGAKLSTMSYVQRQAQKFGFKIEGGGVSKYKCGAVACYCEGAGDCLNLIKSNKCSDDFHCAGNDEGPACVCTQEQ